MAMYDPMTEMREQKKRQAEQDKKKLQEKAGSSYFDRITAENAAKTAQAQLAKTQAENERLKKQATGRAEVMATEAGEGVKFAKNVLGLGEGSLGRQDTSRLQDLSQGLSAEELQASREKMNEMIDRSTQTQNRQLQAIQARQGIRGATAVAQQLGVMQQGQERRANVERDLFLDDRNARIEGLKNLQEAERFNLAQAAQEKYDLAQSGLAFAQMGVTERSAEKARQAQIASAQAAKPSCFDGTSKVIMYDGGVKEIQDIEIGDVLFGGGVVYSCMEFACWEPAYNLDGILVVGSHAIFHDGNWKRVKDIEGLEEVNLLKVYNLGVGNHRIVMEGNEANYVFADYDENDDPTLSDSECLEQLNELI